MIINNTTSNFIGGAGDAQVTINGFTNGDASIAYTNPDGVPTALLYSQQESKTFTAQKGSCVMIQSEYFDALSGCNVSGGFTLASTGYGDGSYTNILNNAAAAAPSDLHSIFSNNSFIIFFFPTDDIASITFTF